jgi:hypothetical protein
VVRTGAIATFRAVLTRHDIDPRYEKRKKREEDRKRNEKREEIGNKRETSHVTLSSDIRTPKPNSAFSPSTSHTYGHLYLSSFLLPLTLFTLSFF